MLAWGLSEAQHRAIHVVRENVFDLQKYLAAENIAHAVAHPLYRVEHAGMADQFVKPCKK